MENAILMASGLGTRMRPLTEKTPKPLIPVHGIPMIETVIAGEWKQSCYCGKMVKGFSDDWVFDLGSDGLISRVGKMGTACHNMVGIAYFLEREAAMLADMIEETYGRDGYEPLFWDEVVDEHLEELKLRIRPVWEEQITEIDTVEKLEAVNSSWYR